MLTNPTTRHPPSSKYQSPQLKESYPSSFNRTSPTKSDFSYDSDGSDYRSDCDYDADISDNETDSNYDTKSPFLTPSFLPYQSECKTKSKSCMTVLKILLPILAITGVFFSIIGLLSFNQSLNFMHLTSTQGLITLLSGFFLMLLVVVAGIVASHRKNPSTGSDYYNKLPSNPPLIKH